ncbi:rho GTPase-activating protein 30 [Labeo rohita]|uniref:rho GTPase-activating protein 30 n=1 Tax=Labeo rohita TaxID=84645 RepID=UPI0021E1FDC1|nr:rho GTPase-activating protein 30 [Labeo rohita]XP_050992334.1 rho GTPase-activating protein 30 [Labeo rohita]
MRRGRRKGGSRDKVFGCDLLEHLNATSQEIPQVLRSCSEFIEKHGIVDGIYRLSGVSSNTQKLRSEFDTEGTPDLYKDVYLQDIHCVSSLCKAYFRELPNPLLTYELYDRFADAVAVQLEDERLVKIKEVLKDLPTPHHRTLEFLMRHLVKMSTFASQTNMHARNLAIVWAPNLLRSKDIESTGFNGTAAFMEVRVQSIVVEFVLTHVPELFPGPGLTVERRKSLPSPQILSSPEDPFFKSLPLHCPGNLSPGDGPVQMRSYHAIIDGTDKRKGSLKGRKWRSIFNLGGRLQDPRKKNKYCPKDKEKTALRPAKSMDSLASGPYAVDDTKHPAALIPPLVLSTASGSSEGVASVGGGVSSGYAVTYRRTGGAQVSMVSGGTPGTYSRLESGGGASGAEGALQGVTRSPGLTSKAERRAGIHISGPFSVTVPLHITSGLALGVLHGGWNEKEQPLQGDEAEDEDIKSTGTETESTDGNPQSKSDDVQERERESKSNVESQVDCGEDIAEITRKENDVPEKGDTPSGKEEAEKENLSQKQEPTKENVENKQPQNKEETTEEDYMDMRGNHHQELASPHYYEDMEFPDLPMDFQEAFGFLDSIDSCAAHQVEFSVEAPCENEYEEEEDENKDNHAISCSSQNCTNDCQTPAANSSSPSFTHRPLPGKSHSLPYKSRNFLPAPSYSSDDEYSPNDDDEDEDDDIESDKSSEYEDMFCKSLPAHRDFQGLSWLIPQTTADSSTSNDVDLHTSNQSTTLPPENNTDVQSIDQSEDTIPAASALTHSSEAKSPLSEEHLNSDVLKIEVHLDEKKNDDSKDVENDKHTLVGEDNSDSEPSEQDTYFGPDSIPPSPEPEQIEIETDSTNVPENIPAPSPTEDAQQVLDADGYHGNSEVTITNELTDAAPQDQPPEEQTQIINETKMEESQTEEDEKREETKVIVELEQSQENEEERENNTKTNTDEGKCEDVEEDAKAHDENEEHEQVNMTETKEHLEEDSEENAKDGSKEVEQDKNKTERQDDLEEDGLDCGENANDGSEEGEQDKNEAEIQDFKENNGDCEENANDRSEEEAEIQDLEENGGEGDEKHAKEEEQEAARQEDLKENNEESENVEGEQDKNEAERREDVEESSEGTSEEDVNVKTESSAEESSVSPEGGDDVEKSTLVHQPDEIQQEHTESKDLKEKASVNPDKISAKPPKRSPRKPANPMKAVPAVPPKPQNSKLTAFTLRKQLQHKQHDDKEAQAEEHGDEDENAENCKTQLSPADADETRLDAEDPRERLGTWEGGMERRREDREAKRNSGISMCFDEAVARATEKRSRERGSTERLSGTQWDREPRKDGKTD